MGIKLRITPLDDGREDSTKQEQELAHFICRLETTDPVVW